MGLKEYRLRLTELYERFFRTKYKYWISNLVLGLLYFRFAYLHLSSIFTGIELSTLINFIFSTVAGIFFLSRRSPKQESGELADWLAAISATYAALLFQPIPGHDKMLLSLLQIFGSFISISSLICLGRSFGIVPANRGIKTEGPYRFVRHPMYTGYLISYGCFTLQNPTSLNYCVYVTFLVLKFVRISLEERILQQDELYRELCSRVKWRLVPFVW